MNVTPEAFKLLCDLVSDVKKTSAERQFGLDEMTDEKAVATIKNAVAYWRGALDKNRTEFASLIAYDPTTGA